MHGRILLRPVRPTCDLAISQSDIFTAVHLGVVPLVCLVAQLSQSATRKKPSKLQRSEAPPLRVR